MENTLRCNRQAGHHCRAPLTDRAVVTTCSHIFCLDCANEVGLADASLDRRQCPTCGCGLPNTDDAVTTSLRPTEDYKTSVLSGLDPTTIMECAGRALAFWTYQTTQEMYFYCDLWLIQLTICGFYQEFISKQLTDKYTSLSSAMDKLVNEANSEIQTLQSKLGALHVDQKSLQQKNAELIDMYREKSKKHTQTQYLYDTLKKKVMQSQIQDAASNSVIQTLQSIGGMKRPGTYSGPGTRRPESQKMAMGRGRSIDETTRDHHGVEQLHRHQRSGSGSGSQVSADAMVMPPPERPLAGTRLRSKSDGTPMHRTQLPRINRASVNRSQIPLSTSRPSFVAGSQNPSESTIRNHMGSSSHLNRQGVGNSNGYGISAGIKIGRVGTSGLGNVEPMTEQYGGHRSVDNTQGSNFDHRLSMCIPTNGPFFHR